MSVLDPQELQASPLADLHTIAAELGLEGFRRLRKQELIDQIVTASGGTPVAQDDDDDVALVEDAAPVPDEVPEDDDADDEERADDDGDEPEDDEVEPEQRAEPDEELRSGILDVLPNGSGFIRAEPYNQSRDDVYVSPAQIRRCELQPGDEVSGPIRPPRRNERHPSLVRVATVNGADADAPSERARFDSLAATWPTAAPRGPECARRHPVRQGLACCHRRPAWSGRHVPAA